MKQPAGFTLIEMSVALALLGFMSVLMFDSLRFGQRSHAAVVHESAQSWQVFAAHRLLRQLIETAYPQPSGEGATKVDPGLHGDTRGMSVMAPAPQAIGGAGRYRYELMLRPDAEGTNDLVIRWRSELASAASMSSERAEEVLIERVSDVQLGYAGPSGWSTRWMESSLPRLVRIQVIFARGDARFWPQMIVAPRLTDNANCQFDVTAQRCRGGS